jgi:hypothetical protein
MKKNYLVHITLLVSIAFLLSACSFGLLPQRGSGNLVTESRDVSGFSKIELNGAGQLKITQGSTESLEIRAEDNILPELTSKVEGSTLILGYKNLSWLRNLVPNKEIVYTLTVIDLTEITFNGAGDLQINSLDTASLELTINGAGNIKIDGLMADSLSARIAGAGSMDIAGEVQSQTITIEGAGNYQAGDLMSQTATINVSGLGNSTLWVTDSLDVTISGGGSVDYYGNPSLTQDVSGIGNIKNIGDK